MFEKVKGYFGFLARHWVLTIAFVIVIVLFLAAPVASLIGRLTGGRFGTSEEA